MELAGGRVILETYGAYAADPAAIAAMLDQAVADMQPRAVRFAGVQSQAKTRLTVPEVRRLLIALGVDHSRQAGVRAGLVTVAPTPPGPRPSRPLRRPRGPGAAGIPG